MNLIGKFSNLFQTKTFLDVLRRDSQRPGNWTEIALYCLSRLLFRGERYSQNGQNSSAKIPGKAKELHKIVENYNVSNRLFFLHDLIPDLGLFQSFPALLLEYFDSPPLNSKLVKSSCNTRSFHRSYLCSNFSGRTSIGAQ